MTLVRQITEPALARTISSPKKGRKPGVRRSGRKRGQLTVTRACRKTEGLRVMLSVEHDARRYTGEENAISADALYRRSWIRKAFQKRAGTGRGSVRCLH